MARVPLIGSREGLNSDQQAVFDWIVESRGQMIRPYEVLLHVPEIARPAAELGHQIRYEGGLSGHDRELAIITAAQAHRCQFEWDSHVELARKEGVSEDTIAAIETGEEDLDLSDAEIVVFVRELCAESTVSDLTLEAIEVRVGTAGAVELSALVGYYTMLGFVMNVAGAC